MRKYFARPNKRFFENCLKALKSDNAELQACADDAFRRVYRCNAIERELAQAFIEENVTDFINDKELGLPSCERDVASKWFRGQSSNTIMKFLTIPHQYFLYWDTLCELLTKALNTRRLTRAEFKTMLANALIQQEKNARYSQYHGAKRIIFEELKCEYQQYRKAHNHNGSYELEQEIKKFEKTSCRKAALYDDVRRRFSYLSGDEE